MKTKKPETEAEWAAYRCQLSCKVGRDALEGISEPPPGVGRIEYALFNLLHAVDELSHAVTDPNRVDKS